MEFTLLPPGLIMIIPPQAVLTILEDCEMDSNRYIAGISKVFFKSGVLQSLQLEKESKLNNFVEALQSLARGALARRKAKKLQVTLL